MGLFNDALDTITAALKDQLEGIEVKDHPGRFTEQELGQLLIKRQAVRVAIEDVVEFSVDGSGRKRSDVRFIAFIFCADTHGEDRHRAATTIAEHIAHIVVYARWGKEKMFKAVEPATIAIENLYSGEVDKGKGLAWWAVSWTQTIKPEE